MQRMAPAGTALHALDGSIRQHKVSGFKGSAL
jgi:hypothetical protein